MTRRLILIRHAKSDWSTPGLGDHQRPLNKRGRASAKAIGDWLRQRDYLPDQILSSSSTRTRETCERMKLNAPAVFLDELYHASAMAMLTELQRATGQAVLMLGHNPGIGDLAERLVTKLPSHPRFLDYPTCATLVADFQIDSWEDADFGMAEPIDFIVPRELV